MPSPLLTKTFIAGAACRARRLAVMGATDTAVIEATGSATFIIGIFEDFDCATGDRCDVVLNGMKDVVLGGTVTRGQPITSDAAGLAIAAAPAAGINARIVGFAMASGVVGDIIPVLIDIGQIQG